MTSSPMTIGLVVLIGALAVLTGLVLLGPIGVVVLGLGVALALRGAGQPAARVVRALGGRRLQGWEVPGLLDTVGGLAARAGLQQRPEVALVPSPVPNAFATGVDGDAVVVLTPGLLQALTPRQVVAVLAHELSHVRAADLRVLGVASSLARFTQTLSLVGTAYLVFAGPAAMAAGLSGWAVVLVLWAPTAATLLLLALSREREHHADAEAAALTGDPEGLAQALWVLERHAGAGWESPGRRAGRLPPAWLRTHPTTQARVERLRRIALGATAERSMRAPTRS